MNDAEVRSLLESVHHIAVLGLSDRPERDSYRVAAYLQSQGYRILPVNPEVAEVLGEKSYPSLSVLAREVPIDLVDVFRRSEAVPAVIDEVLSLPKLPQAVWLQLGVRDEEAASRLAEKGVAFYQDVCLMVEHRRLLRS